MDEAKSNVDRDALQARNGVTAMKTMKTFATFLIGLLAACVTDVAAETNSSKVVERPLAEVRTAIDSFCDQVRPASTNYPTGIYTAVQKNTSEEYHMLFGNCSSPNVWVVAKAGTISPTTTHIEICHSTILRPGTEEFQKTYDAKILQGIVDTLNAKH